MFIIFSDIPLNRLRFSFLKWFEMHKEIGWWQNLLVLNLTSVQRPTIPNGFKFTTYELKSLFLKQQDV